MPGWLEDVRAAWDRPVPHARARVAVPIWRDPWIVVGRDTFTGDLLHRRGYRNVFADHPDRYPTVALAEIDRADVDLVLLPGLAPPANSLTAWGISVVPSAHWTRAAGVSGR